jgi:hypothetical protein
LSGYVALAGKALSIAKSIASTQRLAHIGQSPNFDATRTDLMLAPSRP